MARKKGKGRAVKSARQKFGLHHEDEDLKNAPHTMVINRGDVDKQARQLITDMRKVMEPYTAADLKVKKQNCLKDFVNISGPLHVSHLIIISQTEVNGYLKLIRLPRGPTLHFSIEEFSLCKDVVSSIKRPSTNQKQYLHQPLLILNGFNAMQISAPELQSELTTHQKSESMKFKLMSTMLQNMFAPINIAKVKLREIKRCVLFNYNAADDSIDFRHYNIKLSPVGLSKSVKKLVQEQVPDLSNLNDISEFISKSGYLSESEAEFDNGENQVADPDATDNGDNLKTSKSAVRLTEIGPRLKLKLIKIQEGVCDGEILYHKYIQKSPEEIQKIREKLKTQKSMLKKSKPKVTDKNPKTKKKAYNNYKNNNEENNDDDIDDAEYFRQEVGHEPEPEFFKASKKRKDFHFTDEFRNIDNVDKDEKAQASSDDEDLKPSNKKAKTFAQYEKVKTPATSKFFRLSKKNFNNKLGKKSQN